MTSALDQALQLKRSGRLDEAVIALEGVLGRAPHDGFALGHLAEVQLRRGRVDDAAAVLDRAEAATGTTAFTARLRGDLSVKADDYAGAARAYADAVALGEAGTWSLVRLARCRLRTKDLEGAGSGVGGARTGPDVGRRGRCWATWPGARTAWTRPRPCTAGPTNTPQPTGGPAVEAARSDLGCLTELADLDARVGPATLTGEQMASCLDLGSRPAAEVAQVMTGERLLRHPLRLAADQLLRRMAADLAVAALVDVPTAG